MTLNTVKTKVLIFLASTLLLLIGAGSALAQNCTAGQVAANEGCKYTRTVSTPPAAFVPVPVRNAEGVMLYPKPTPANCDNSQQDSNCTVLYTYTNPNPPPTITAGFTNTAPIVGVTSTSPFWNSTNAVSVTSNCYGVANTSSGVVALQGNPSGLIFNASVAGSQTCIYVATNSVGIATSATASVIFKDPPPAVPKPTISVVRSPSNRTVDQFQSLTWSTTGATTLTRVCTASGSGWTSALASFALSGTGGGTGLASSIGYPTICLWTAQGQGGTTTYSEVITTIAAPVVLLPVYRFRSNIGTYFYTASTVDRDSLTTPAQAAVWTYEGPAFSVYAVANAVPGILPAYRFYNDAGGRFYTVVESERSYVASLPNYHYELIAWYAMGSAANGAIPLYRFYQPNGTHFYTASLAERNWILANIPSWAQDPVSQYVWP